jgi:thiamine-monophosphate kinase
MWTHTRLGHKALAVNLSDLAACGAKPLAFTLALALPQADASWLAPFSQGLLALADAHDCELIGGDTTQGPLNICITVFGEVPVTAGQSLALLRSGAQPGDDLYVSGTLGDARLALEALRGTFALPAQALARARLRLETPTPRVALGLALRGVASSAIDISDGLVGDLGHILESSAVGAVVNADIATELIAARARCSSTSAQFDINLQLWSPRSTRCAATPWRPKAGAAGVKQPTTTASSITSTTPWAAVTGCASRTWSSTSSSTAPKN